MQGKTWTAMALAALLLLLAGCGQEQGAPAQPPLVKYQRADGGATAAGGATASALASTYAGSVRGRYENKLAFQVGGRLARRDVEVGSRVAAGQVLMSLDPKDVQAQLDAAKTQLTLAQTNFGRYGELLKAGAVSQLAYDQARTTYEAALATHTQADNALAYTRLTANGAGVIADISAEVGQVVAAGTPVATLVQTDELEVEVNVPEGKPVAVGQAATVSFWALGDATATGVVREVAPMADSVSRTYRVRVSLPNPPERLELGMSANVCLGMGSEELGANKAVVLPLTAIYQTGEQAQVWVVDAGKKTVSLKAVTVAAFDAKQRGAAPSGKTCVRVTGLAPTDLVVTAGVHRLHEGQAVRLGDEESKP